MNTGHKEKRATIWEALGARKAVSVVNNVAHVFLDNEHPAEVADCLDSVMKIIGSQESRRFAR